ncbi:unnamed protein product [Chrysodeixis includens]|uniref:DNA polymerase delta subunit 3 n=1 Tax=Chrysodeixis includens TaxID=689277 RepID=A0A9N8KVA5_CHRIL|nr:unnamed protein product [Chrysodeixis includens]
MDSDTFKSNLNTVKELILDENKVVTYVSLSKDLCIHVNDAKSLLKRIVQDIRKDRPSTKLYVCHIISGLQDNNCGMTTVCSEEDLEKIKNTLRLVFYEHVYCVSRGLQTADNAVLSSLNRFEDLSLCTGLIKGDVCTKRTENELGSLISKKHTTIIESKTPSAQLKKSNDKAKETVKSSMENFTKLGAVKSEPKIKTEAPEKDVQIKPKTPTKNNISKTPPKNNNSKTPPKNNNSKPAAKGIAGFFNKSNGVTNKAKSTEQKSKTPVEPIKVKDEPLDSNSNLTSEVEKPPVKNSKNSKEETNHNKSLTQIKKNAKVDKKRKRVLHVSDSESDAEADPFSNEMDVDHESEDEIPPTPTISTVKITSGIVNPKKRRKIVDKTYTDEEGYILTKKEEVYESCSDNEESTKENDSEVKANGVKEKNIKESESNKQNGNNEVIQVVKSEISPKQNKKKKVSPPQKGKQKTINSFFTKL